MKQVILVALAAAVCGGAVRAQSFEESDAMEVQRCVWRCLADSPGAASAEYEACVAAQCNGPPQEQNAWPAAPAAQAPAWYYGATSDGQGRYAGVVDPAFGTSFYYMCDARGQSLLAINGPEAGLPAPLAIIIDNVAYSAVFSGRDLSSHASVAMTDPVIAALTIGRMLEVRNSSGSPLGRFSLVGSGQAIAAARQGCR